MNREDRPKDVPCVPEEHDFHVDGYCEACGWWKHQIEERRALRAAIEHVYDDLERAGRVLDAVR